MTTTQWDPTPEEAVYAGLASPVRKPADYNTRESVHVARAAARLRGLEPPTYLEIEAAHARLMDKSAFK